jgi:hypothetical protein
LVPRKISREGKIQNKGVVGLKVKYIGETAPLELVNGEVYSVISVEKDWYRIFVDALSEAYLYPPNLFEIVEP